MDRNELTATSWFGSRLVVALFAGLGFFFIAQPDWLGYAALSRALGGETKLIAAGVGLGFLVLAALHWSKSELRVRMAELMEALHQLLYGKDYRRDREAIEILMNSLDSQDPTAATSAYARLSRLTGQNFAQDPKVWRSWWETHKKSFERSKLGAEVRKP